MTDAAREPTRPADQDARDAIADDLDATLVVEAAAGTGKTTELVNRILRVLETGRAEIDEIVAVTFTEKAAGELKLRLREALELRRATVTAADASERLDAALSRLEEAHVNTIHGFCADLLRERPVEARVDPLFAVLTEAQALRLYGRAFRAWLQGALEQPPPGVRRALRRTASAAFGDLGEGDGPVGRLQSAGWKLAEARDYPTPWRRTDFDRDREVAHVLNVLHHVARLSSDPLSPRDNLHFDLGAVRRLSQQVALEQSFGTADVDGWESRLVDLARDRGLSNTRKGSGYKYSATVTRTELLAARDALVADLQQFKKNADADLAAHLHMELRGATDRYIALKDAMGALDFTDLLSRTRELLSDNAEVRAFLQRRFKRIFVDEFQDTDPVQAEILMRLAGSDDGVGVASRLERGPHPGKLFIVGDPKQSIYRFRGTDVETYWRICSEIERHGGRRVQLTTSFRSVPGIQRFVNAVFRPAMVADGRALQPGYVALSESRAANDAQPSVVVLPVPKPYSDYGMTPKVAAKAIERSLPDAVGAYIEWLVHPATGWRVSERDAETTERWVPLQPRHIAVLFRRFTSFGEDVTRPYIEAIEARSIPHLLVGGRAFHDREEVETIRAALAAIEWPDDELNVFATLRGALFAVDDGLLFEWKSRFGAFHPYRIPREVGGNSGVELALSAEDTAHLLPIAEALRLLQDLHRRRNARPVADTIGRLLSETRAHVAFILRPAGEQALANVLQVAELARRYEVGGGISFRGFIDELRSTAESETAEAPILEDTSDGVRLMTVHKAKGLEFPVVILADLTCRLSRNDASRYVDGSQRLCAIKLAGWAPHELYDHEADEVARDQAEAVRLAYVAATRARDLLVIPAIGDQPWEGGWLSPLNQALYPPAAMRRHATRGPQCPAFKSKDSVLSRPQDEPALPMTVCPGQHDFSNEGGYRVVWWDPSALHLGATPPFGVRRGDLVVKDVPKNVVADGRSAFDRWTLARLDARTAGSKPSVAVMTVRELVEVSQAADSSAEGGEGDAPSLLADPVMASGASARLKLPAGIDPAAVEIVDVAGSTGAAREAPGGAAFGTLVHAVLAQAPFDATNDRLQALALREATLLGLSGSDATRAATRVGRVLRHALMRRAARAAERGSCRRETPVSFMLPDAPGGSILIEGVVDLAFEEDGRWITIDYKTDRELSEATDRYRWQVAVYAHAIGAATSRPTEAILMRV